jgi:hypothetical protein
MSQTGIAPEILRGLRESLHGTLICPGDEDYEAARRVWNGMIDRQPTLIYYSVSDYALRCFPKHALTVHL